jgi:hypothetical protein
MTDVVAERLRGQSRQMGEPDCNRCRIGASAAGRDRASREQSDPESLYEPDPGHGLLKAV